MPQVPGVAPVGRRKWRATGVVVAASVVGLAVLGYVGWYYLGGPTATQTASDVNQLNSESQYAQALAKLDKAYPRALSKSDKALLLSGYASTAYDQGDYAKSVSYYEKLNVLQPNNAATLVSLGETAQQAGNSVEAAKAFEAAIPLMKAMKPGPTTANNIQALEQEVKGLEQ